MSLDPGFRLGPYEIKQRLGAGGMGEVFRSHDARLGRDVAIKIVGTDGTASADRLARFEDEARAVARLTHPNVLTVFDVGTCDGRSFVVFELLEGQTLREQLTSGAWPLTNALDMAIHVCRGLQAAHSHGIVHRDLKPENIFLTSSGLVKILDFGLAKLTWGDGASAPGLSSLRTATVPGLVLGTPGYLSPEQAKGDEADGRSDLFALGAVLYEALSGRRAFSGPTPVATMAAILHDDPPPLKTITGAMSAAVERVVRRCLDKDPARRFQSAHDLALALEGLLEASRLAPSAESLRLVPYPGLASFGEADAPRFFGREAEVEAIWRRIPSRPLLAVIGPSGTGKTSFVRAGVVASRPAGWGAMVTTPGASPLLMLGLAAAPALQGDAQALRHLVRFEEPDEAFQALVGWRQAHAGALLVVDQFEELFTLCSPEARARFAALLGRLAQESGVHVLISMRDDFLMRCHEHEPLGAVFKDLTPLGPLTGRALRKALEEPARIEGFTFEDGLVEAMATAVEGERGALPLLAFAVSRLWDLRDREHRRLTQEAYVEIGGVAGALAQHAEATLERIGPLRQAMVREVFRNLVTAEGTRSACDRDELLSVLPDRSAAEEVLGELVSARLLTSWEMPGCDGERTHSGGQRIEIVHESLLSSWLRLVRWQAQDADGALLRDQLRQAAHLWSEKRRPKDLLWAGTSFREFDLWKERYTGRLTKVEDDFARAMSQEALRRRRWRRAMVAAAFLGLGAVAAVVGWSRHQAVVARERAEAGRLVALGRLELEAEPSVALAYASASLVRHDTPEARRLALEALWRGPVASVLPIPAPANSEACLRVAASPDGRWLSCSGWGPTVRLFSSDGRLVHTLSRHRDAARTRSVLFSDDSKMFATFAAGDSETVVWSVDGREVARLRPGGVPRHFPGDELVLLEEPADGRPMPRYVSWRLGSAERRVLGEATLAGSDIDARHGLVLYAEGRGLFARPFGMAGSTEGRRLGGHGADVTGVGVARDSGRIVSVDVDHQIRIWDGAAERKVRSLAGTDADRLFRMPVLAPNGKRLAWQSMRRMAFALWDLTGPPGAEPLWMRRRDIGSDRGDGAFLGQGRWLATALGDRLAFWPVEMPWPRVIPLPETGLVSVGFSSDSRQLATCGTQASRVHPVTPEAPAAYRIQLTTPFPCYGLAMDPSAPRVLLAAPTKGAIFAALDGGVPQNVLPIPPTESINAVAVDGTGRWLATATVYSPERANRLMHLFDRHSGTARTFALPGAEALSGYSGGVFDLAFVAGGRLLAVGAAGLHRWNPEEGTYEVLRATPCGSMSATVDGRQAVMACRPLGTPFGEGPPRPSFELLIVESPSASMRSIESHGRDITAVAMSPTGEWIATGDSTGTIRVGLADGREPHLLLGASGTVKSLSFSPDGRWLASATNELRLWPMPDPSKVPLHALPLEALLALLGSLTNVRVIEDPSASSGYRVDLAPFGGWERVPAW